MGWVGWVASAEVDSTSDRAAPLLLHFHLQGLGLGDDLQVGSSHGGFHVLPEHVCPLTSLLGHLELAIALLQGQNQASEGPYIRS